jgi:hypothetical protein
VAGLNETDVTIRDLQNAIVTAFEGRTMTVGATQKFTGRIKRSGVGQGLKVGAITEKMYPLVRFTLNPFFQFQEALEPFTFMAARGLKPGVTLDEIDRGAQNIIERYAGSSDYSKFDMMERSLMVMWGDEAARTAFGGFEGSATAGRISTGLSKVKYALKWEGHGKLVAERKMFREFLGQEFRERINRIDPTAFSRMAAIYGTSDPGAVAVRWMREADLWAQGDPQLLGGLLATAARSAQYGDAATLQMPRLVKLFGHADEQALQNAVISGRLTRGEFDDRMDTLGASAGYRERAWTAMHFDVEGFYNEAAALARGGMTEVNAVRGLIKARAEALNLSERELLSRRIRTGPVSIGSEDFLGMSASELDDIAASLQLVRNPGEAHLWRTGKVFDGTHADVEQAWLARTEPDDAVKARLGAQAEMRPLEKINFGGRSVYIPGGEAALRDNATEWTIWEHNVVRSQMINPADLTDESLKVALYRKMWASHALDLTADDAPFRVFNNMLMSVFSPNMNLTRNEMIATRLRAGSMDDVIAIAERYDAIAATLPADAKINDIGFAYSTHIGNYVPAGRVADFVADAEKTFKSAPEMLRMAEVAEEYATKAKTSTHDTSTAPLAQYVADIIEEAITAGRDWREAVPSWTGVRSVEEIAGKAKQRPADLPPVKADEPWREAYEKIAAAYPVADEKGNWKSFSKQRLDKVMAEITAEKIDPDAVARWMQDVKYAQAMRDYEGAGATAARMATDNTRMLGLVQSLRDEIVKTSSKRADIEARIEANWDELTPEQMSDLYGEIDRLTKAEGASADVLYAMMPGLAAADTNIAIKPWNYNGATTEAGRSVHAYIKNADVKWRNMATNRAIGSAAQLAKAVRDDPDFFRLRPGETRDMFAERILNTTNGLAIKTGYFGIDLSGVEAFERGIMDRQMVGVLTNWLYQRAFGTPEWDTFYSSLTKKGKDKIDLWIEKGRPTKAGDFGWTDAAPRKIGHLKTITPEQIAARKADGTLREWVTRQMDKALKAKAIDQSDYDRFFQTFNLDSDLEKVAGRDVILYGGDYKAYDTLLTQHKQEALDNGAAWLNEVGNGAYQWYLWDEFRNVYDPELSVINASHGVDPISLRRLAVSDDIHRKSGYLDKGGLPQVGAGVPLAGGIGPQPYGHNYLDPLESLLAQSAGGGRVRGASILLDDGRSIVALSELADRSTFLHEIVHTIFEQELHPSGRQVFIDDFNQKARLAADQQVFDRADRARLYTDSIKPRLDAQSDAAARRVEATESGVEAGKATRAAQKATREREAAEAALGKAKAEADLIRKQVEPVRRKEAKRLLAEAEGKYQQARQAEEAARKALIDIDNEIEREAAARLAAMPGDAGRVAEAMSEVRRLVKRTDDLVPGSRIRITTNLMISDLDLDYFIRKAGPLVERVGFHEYYLNVPKTFRPKYTQSQIARSRRAAEAVGKSFEVTRKAYADLTATRKGVSERLADLSTEVKRAEANLTKAEAVLLRREGEAAVVRRMEPLAWDAANTAKALADAARQAAKDADDILAAARRAEDEALAALDEATNRTIPPQRYGWDRDLSEHFVAQFQLWVSTGRAPNAKMRDAFAYFANWLRKVWDFLRQNPDARVSPQVQGLLEDMFRVQPQQAFVVPFDATQEAMHQAAMTAAIRAEDSAHTNVYFRRKRNWIERSANHPYFGFYPASYMWGKVLPEMVRFLAAEPFGIEAPFGGLLAAQNVWNSIEMQKDSDTDFREFMSEDEKRLRVLGMLLPATPWDIPVNTPLWSRRLAEWGLESQDRVERTQEPKGFDLIKTAKEVGEYAIGPTATLGTVSDLAKWGGETAGNVAEATQEMVNELTTQQQQEPTVRFAP